MAKPAFPSFLLNGETMPLTNKEIAKRLSISESTLSFIINNKPGVAQKTRDRVIREINDLGYEHILRKDAPVLTKSICFLVYKRHGQILDQSPFFMLLMEQIEERARASGYNLLVRMIDGSDSLAGQINAINASDLSGIIIFATEMQDDDMEYFKHASKPIVSLDNDFSHLEIDSVVINNKVGTMKAIDHLVGLGHREIGYLQCKTYISSFGEREEGYRKAMALHGLELAPAHVFKLGFTEEEAYQDFKEALTAETKLPTAFVSDTDTITAGAMRALLEHNVKIPEAVSLVGFDNRPLCQHVIPHLTSIAVPKIFGSRAVDLLVERIAYPLEDEIDYRKIEVGVGLIPRKSTRQLED